MELLLALILMARPPHQPALTIGLVDTTGLLTSQIVRSLQTQLDRDVAPTWHRTARLVIGPGDWTVTIQFPIPFAGFQGFHSIMVDTALPYAVVGVDSEHPWTQVLSHEIIEMVIDPQQTMRQAPLNLSARCPLCEAAPSGWVQFDPCDPVQGERYAIDGVLVSDFVLPGWFLQGYHGKLDFLDTNGVISLWP
jgi:hypothetical protein